MNMKNSVLYKNITVVTPTEDGRVECIPDCFVSVGNGIILYIGKDISTARNVFSPICNWNNSEDKPGTASNVSLNQSYEEYSGADRIMLPTFANGHSHLPMTLLKNSADDLNLNEWLFDVILPREKNLRQSDIYYGSLLGMAEMIDSGTGCTADMYFMPEETARAALESGFRINLCHEGKYQDNDKWFADDSSLLAFKNKYHHAGEGLLKISLMVHSVYLYPEYLYELLAVEAKRAGVSVLVHLSETITENQNCIMKYGKTPAEALRDFGLFDCPCIAAHGVHLSETDMDILADKKVTVAHNPSSNLKLASGVCDVRSLLNKGVNVCIGTDGSASNNNLDMYIEMRFASLVAKERFSDPANMNANTTLYLATRGGYTGMGFTNCGLIRPGMSADLQIVRCDLPSIWPVGNPISALVYSTPSSAVESVMIAGKFVKYRGELKTIDFEKVKYEVFQASKRLTSE